MKFNILFTLVLLFSSTIAMSQTAIFNWAGTMGATSSDRGQAISTDAFGNVYVAGYFRGTSDFDPGTGVYQLTSNGGTDIFIQKLDSSGVFVWAHSFGSSGDDMALGVSADSSGNVYITGDFRNTVDFDPSTSVSNLVSSGNRDMFILKLSANGNFIWTGRVGGTGVDGARRVLVDNSGDIIISGWFAGVADFDIGVLSSLHTSSGNRDIFILKMDSAGTFLWAKTMGSSGFDVGYGITNDQDGNIFQTGLFEGTVDFDPSASVLNLSSNGGRDSFISKYSSSGTFLWVKKVGGSGNDSGNFLDTDDGGNVYIHGQFIGTVDFNPGSGVANKTAVGSFDTYLLKLSGTGDYRWVVPIGGPSDDLGQGMRVDGNGNSYITGYFKGTADFNPGSAVNSLTSAGGKDAYIAKYDSLGLYKWAQHFSGTNDVTGKAVELDGFGNLVETGWFSGAVDLNSGSGVSNFSSIGGEDIFVTKFRVCYPSSSVISASHCSSYTSPSGNYTWTSSGVYTDVINNTGGCDSIITISLTINNSFSTITATSCGLYTSPSGSFTWNASGTYVDTIPNSIGCDSIITINLTVNGNTLTTISPTSCGAYNSPSGNYIWSTSGIYYDTIPIGNGCDILFTVNLTVNNSSSSSQIVTACDLYNSPSGNYSWTSTGIYSDTLTNSVGCDSILTINLTVNSSNSITISPTVCASYTSPSGNYVWTNSGTYLDTVSNVNGCDSVLTIQLLVNNSYTSISTSACNSYTSPSGKVWIASGVYQDTVLNSTGCDSVLTINLTLNTNNAVTENVIACNSYTWSANGLTYLSSGSHTKVLTNTGGCDSVVTLNLTVNSNSFSIINVTNCDSYTSPSGANTWTGSGTYSDVMTSSVGCDSVLTINLTIISSSASIQTVSSCNSYFWSVNSMTYSVGGVYVSTLVNSVGCDSIITLNLSIHTSSASVENVTACNSYSWASNGALYTTGGQYLDTLVNSNGCDSLLILNLTLNQTTTSTQNITSCDTHISPSGNYVWNVSGTYLDTIPNLTGCDSIITIVLTIHNSTSSVQSVTSCDSYTWSVNSQQYTSSGIYMDTVINTLGCDSIISLLLTVNSSSATSETIAVCDTFTWVANGIGYNASGVYSENLTNAAGCDSVVTLNLTINNSNSSLETVSICGSYYWVANAVNYTNSGVYMTTLQNANGCDSVATLDLTINTSSSSNQTVSVCDSLSSPGGNYVWTTSGTYMDTLVNSTGCDSIITTNLTVDYTSIINETVVSCDSYLWLKNNVTYVASGMYSITVSSGVGCDSISNLILTINTSDSITQTETSCDSFTWLANGTVYTNSGTYVHSLINATGCDSVVTLNLFMLNSTVATETVVSCGDYTWALNGNVYPISGTYVDTTVNSNGCDSIVTLNLTINTNSAYTLNESSCGVYTAPDGSLYSITGQYFAVIPNSVGCDSTITINLTVTNIDTSVSVNGFILTANATGSFTYQWLDCNNGNTAIVGATNQSYTPSVNGDYAVEISDGVCLEGSNCINVTGVGVADRSFVGVSLYPNPANNEIYVDRGSNEELSIFILDNAGKIVKSVVVNSQHTTIDIRTFSSGIYFVKILTDKGLFVERVIKK